MSPRHRLLLQALVALALGGGCPVGAHRPARAADLRMTVERPRFTCEGSGTMLSHVVWRPATALAATASLPCCDGKLACAQFLSTNTVVHPPRRWHS